MPNRDEYGGSQRDYQSGPNNPRDGGGRDDQSVMDLVRSFVTPSVPAPYQFPFMGTPSSFMPQIAPTQMMSPPQNLEQLYAAYGVNPMQAFQPPQPSRFPMIPPFSFGFKKGF